MDIYTIFMLIATVMGIHVFREKGRNRGKRNYCILMGLLLFLIAALRNTSVGVDSAQYAHHFETVQRMSIYDILVYQSKDPFFFVFIKLLSGISSDHQIMFAVIGALYSISISRFIYKYSQDVMMSFVMLIPMMYFAFSLTGLRQTLAISILLFSIDFIIKRRLINFGLTVVLASLFHKSAIFFFPAYIIINKKIDIRKTMFLLVTGIFVYFLRRPLVFLVQRYFYKGYRIASYGNEVNTWGTFIVYVLILAVVIFFKNQLIKKDENVPLFISLLYIGALIQMFVPLQPNIFRISMYYNITSIILVPGLVKTQAGAMSKFYAYAAFYLVMGIEYFFFTFYSAGVNPYHFFWE